jgi:hypothetical protein
MNWASKYNDDEVIECGLQLVDLHHQEQNAAPQIVALVAEGDFDSALKRIEQFGGNDKEGLQRKFILYMLCLMELTLLDSKDKPFREEGIEKILKHLDEQLPVDHSVLNVADFYPLNSIFQIMIELEKISVDYLFLKKYYNRFLGNWICEIEVIQKFEANVILKQIDSLEFTDDEVIDKFSQLLIENYLVEEYYELRAKIFNDRKKIYNTIYVLKTFKSIGNIKALNELVSNIEIFRNNQKDELLKSIIDARLKIQLMQINNSKINEKMIFEFLELFKNVKPVLNSSVNYRRGYALLISSFLSEFYFNINEKTKSYLLDELNMSFIFSQLLIELTIKTNNLSILNTLLIDSERIDNVEYKIQVQSIISGKYRVLKESIQCHSINKKLVSILKKEKDGLSKNRTIVLLIKELSKQGEFILVKKLLNNITAYHEVSNANTYIAIGKLVYKSESTFVKFLENIDGQTSKFKTIKEAYENYNCGLCLKTSFFESFRIDFKSNASEQIKTEFISNLIDLELDSVKIENAIKLLSKLNHDRLSATIIRKIVDLIEVDQLHLYFNERTSNLTIGIDQLNQLVIAEKAYSLLLKGFYEESIQLFSKIENKGLKIRYLVKSAELLYNKGNSSLSEKLIAEIDKDLPLESKKNVEIEIIRLSLVKYMLLTNQLEKAINQTEQLKGTFKNLSIISISNYLKSLGEKVKAKELLEQITYLPELIKENLLLNYDDVQNLINQININDLRELISSQCEGNTSHYWSVFYRLAKISAGVNNLKAAFYFVEEIKELGIKKECFQELSSIIKNQFKAAKSMIILDHLPRLSDDEKKCLVNAIPMNEYSLNLLTDLVKLHYRDVMSIKDCFLKYNLNSFINNDQLEFKKQASINIDWAKGLKKSA